MEGAAQCQLEQGGLSQPTLALRSKTVGRWSGKRWVDREVLDEQRCDVEVSEGAQVGLDGGESQAVALYQGQYLLVGEVGWG
jgi:hypothetical protein